MVDAGSSTHSARSASGWTWRDCGGWLCLQWCWFHLRLWEKPRVAPDPDPILGEDGVHGLMIWVDWVDGDVVDVPIPVCDWVPTVCAANPSEMSEIANVSHFARILSS